MKLRIMYLAMAVFVLIAGITFAWMDFSKELSGGAIVYQYGGETGRYMGVANIDFEAQLEILRGELYVPIGPDEKLALTDLVPSESVHFKLRFTNKSIDPVIGDTEGTPIKVNVYLTGITAEKVNAEGKPKISEVLYFSIVGSEGYMEGSVNKPENMLVDMQSILEPETYDGNGNPITYRATLLKDLVIPVATEATQSVSVICYILFDREATVEYENCDMSYDHIMVSIAQ